MLRRRLQLELLESRRVLAGPGPEVVSILRADASPTNASQVAFDVTFDEAVTGVDVADFSVAVSGITGPSVANVTGSGAVYQVVVNTGIGEGTLRLDVVDNDSILDNQSKPLGGSGTTGTKDGSFFGGESYDIDTLAPTTSGATLVGTPSPSDATVDFTIAFSESVQTVDASKFLLEGSASASASIQNVTGSGSSYVISVNTGSGQGELRVDFVDDDTVTDALGNFVDGIGSQAITGQSHSVDHVAPTIVAVDRVAPTTTTGNSIQYLVSYSEPVLNVQAADFLVITSPAASPQPPISSVDVVGANATVTVDVSSYEGAVYLYARDGDITDAAGNAMATQVVASQQFYVDRTPPTVTSVLLEQSTPNTLSDLSFLVTLSETVNGFTTADVAIDQVGFPGAAVSSIEHVSGTQRRVHVSTGQGQGTLSIDIVGNQTIRDLANQKIVGDSNDHPAYTIDNLAPSVESISLVGSDPIITSTFEFQVVFSEPVTGVTSAAFDWVATGAVAATIDSVTGTGDTYVVTVSNSGDTGTIGLLVNDDDSIVDVLLNPLGGTGSVNGDFASAVFGIGTTGRITGRVVDDLDRDGFADLGEPGISGVTVYVDENGNGQFDLGEPSAVTQSDDAGTAGIDETGVYLITGVEPGEQAVRMVQPVGWMQTNPALRAAGTGHLTQVQLLEDNVGGNNALEEVAGVTESPDGNFVYIAAYTDNAVTVYSRNSATGILTRIQTVANGTGGVAGLIGAQSIAITRDGQHLYVASAIDDALVMFSRDESSGLLTYLGHLKQGVAGVDGLLEPTAIRESADGKNLYVAAVSSNSLSVFDRDPTTGLVTFAQKLTGATGGSFSVDLSPDQRHVYLSSGISHAVSVYERDLETGHLTLIQTVTKSTAGFSTLNEPWGIAVSPDGENVYVAARLSQGVVVLNRDAATGHVSFNQFVADPFTTSNPDPVAVLVSPDGHHVAVTYQTAGGLAIYSRDSATGALTLVEFYKNNVGGINQMFGAWDVEYSNDGQSLYLVAAYDDTVYVFDRDVGDWVPASTSASVSVGETTTLGAFGAANLVPSIQSLTYSGVTPVTAATVDFDVWFSEPVTGVDVGDFTFGGSFAGATASGVTGSGASYTLTVDLADGFQGTLSPQISLAGGIVDNEGQPLSGVGSGVIDVVDVDRKDPTLLSATRLDSDPTNQTILRYELQFSEAVTGLDLVDLSVVVDGVTGGAVDSVSGSGDTYVVTISHTGGEGTIGLVLSDNDSVVDAASHPLDGIGTAAIQLASYSVQLGAIDGIVFDDLDSDGVMDAGELGVEAMTVFLDMNQNGVSDAGEPTTITDSAGNYAIAGLVDGTYSVRWQSEVPYEQTSPVGGAAHAIPVAVASGNSVANFGIRLQSPGDIAGRAFYDANQNGLQNTSEYGVEGLLLYLDLNDNGVFESATEPSTVTAVDDPGTTAVNEAGQYEFNLLTPGDYRIRSMSTDWPLMSDVVVTSGTLTNRNLAVFNAPPTLVSITTTAMDVWTDPSVVYTVTFSEPVSGFTDDDLTIGTSLFNGVSDYVVKFAVDSITGGPTVYSVTLGATVLGQGKLQLWLNDFDRITDSLGIPLGGVGDELTVGISPDLQVDLDTPQVQWIDETNSPILGSYDAQFVVRFTEVVSGVDVTDFVVAQTGVVGAVVTSVTPRAGNRTFDVSVGSGTQDGTLQLQLIDDDSILDAAGKPLGGIGVSNGDFLTGAIVSVERNSARDIVGNVFSDENGNGVWEPGTRGTGEPVAAGARVYLDTNDNGTRDLTEPFRTTDVSGHYEFADQLFGTYYVRVESTTNWIATANSSKVVTLDASTAQGVADLPVAENLSAIEGIVFDDLNQNGVRDAGELGVDGFIVYVDTNLNQQLDTFEQTMTTLADDSGTPEDESGTYRFSPLDLSFHNIRIEPQSAYLSTSPMVLTRTLTTATSVETAEFGVTPNATSISGVVFDDLNGDGIQDVGEGPVVGWIVYLDADNDGQLDPAEVSDTTDATGHYAFDQLSLGTHRVAIMRQVGHVITSPSSVLVSITSSTDAVAVEFATHTSTTTISGGVFDDVNANGVTDAGEGPLANAVLYLDANDNARLDAGERTTTTDASGQYTFTDIQPGDVVVRVVPPVGYDPSAPSSDVDRLFVWHGSNTLREVHPIDGSTIADYWRSTDPTTSIQADGLAFDGTSLWALDRGQYSVFEIDPDAATIERTIDVSALNPITHGIDWNGLAVIGSTMYVSAADGEFATIDLESGFVTDTDSVFLSNPGSPFLVGVNQILGLGVSSDGQSLVVSADAGKVLTLDPVTLTITGSDAASTGFQLSGVGSVGGTTYVSQINSSSLLVFDSSGNQTGTLPIGCQAVAVAGGVYQDHAVRLTVALDQQVTGVDFGVSQFAGAVSGIQFIDENSNGQFDTGEQPAAGVTVFADLNDNGSRDIDEPFGISAADGSYTIEGVPPGNVVVRATSGSHRPSDAYTSQDRLFGLRSTGSLVRIDELDPATGAIINTVFTSVPYNAASAMAFDGQRLIVIDSSDDMLYQIGLDGSLISSRHLGEPYINPTNGQLEYTPVTDYGPAVIGGLIYSVRPEFGGLSLYTYDPETDEFEKVMPITFDWGLETMPVSFVPDAPAASYGSGVSADGQRILLVTNDDRLIEINPANGVATFNASGTSTNGNDYAIDSVGGETFLSFSGRIEVVDNDGNLLRNLTGIPTYLGLAGGKWRDNGHVVDVIVAQEVTADHGHVSTLATISGTVVADANENGIADVGESVVAGATLFLDLDHNGLLDAGEPTATTDASGAYTFTDVVLGDYQVRYVTSASTLARAFTADQTRLFQAIRGTDDIVVIQELDPFTGEVLNQFDPPLPNATGIGLAAKGDRLYYSRSGAIDVLDADDGIVLDTIAISTGTRDGLAIIGDRAYVQHYNQNTIDVVDLVTQRIVDTLDIGLANGGSPGSFNLAYSLAEAPDGVNLAVVPFSGSEVVLVDPTTGLIVDTLENIFAGYGSTSAGGEYFERGFVSGGFQTTISVRDHLGLQRRAIPLSYQGYVFGLGATSVPSPLHRVTAFAEQTLSGLDFGSVPRNVTISGIQFDDANANGVQDAGETGLAGVTVFADINANGLADAGEPSTVSLGDGSYALTDVPRGSQWIRTLATGYAATSSLGATDRMFGTTRVAEASSPTQYVLQIRELDPATGLAIAYTTTNIPVLAAYTSAFLKDRLIIVDNGQDKIMQVALDGTLVGEAPLPSSGGSIAYAQGPAVIDGTVYVTMSGGGAPLRLERYDVETNQFFGAMRISEDVSQSPAIDPMPQISESVAESPDGKSIVLFSNVDERVFIVDPLTARVTSVVNLSETDNSVYSAATLGGELFARGSSSSSNLNVYDASYTFLRQLGNPGAGGLAAGTDSAFGVRVDANSGATTNVDIGQRAIHTDVTGIVSLDTNLNGVVDPGEESVGETVYLDANRNGIFDVGESSTTTLADGTYTFTQLPPGDYSVAVNHAVTERVVTNAVETALFALEVAGGASTIRKHDVITGQVLREFPAPGVSMDNAGLAVDEYGLYYSSSDGVWVLDHDTGAVRDFFDLSDAIYDGLAAIGGRLFVLASFTNSIISLDPRTGVVIDTFAINAINGTSYTLSGNLGESTDGENLILRMPSGGGLVIDPDTGLIDRWYAYNYGAWAIAGADGELYRFNGGTTIRVESELEQQIRLIPVGYESRAIAAAVIPASTYELRAAEEIRFAARDFQLAPSDQFPTTTISGTVWSDADRDGTRDAGESGIAGVTVYLDLNHNGVLDAADISQVTLSDDPVTTAVDETGSYSFIGLSPGSYEVRQQLLPSSIGTSPVNPILEYDQRYDTNFVAPAQFQHYPVDDLRLSETGRYLVYSTVRQVLPDDTNSISDIYLVDRVTNEQELISISTAGATANGASFEPGVSGDGRYVIFRTLANDLDAVDTDGFLDVYLRDRLLGTTTLLTKGIGGGSANGHSRDGMITPDGRFVVLTSWGDQLVSGDTNNVSDAFVFDLQANAVQRVSTTEAGEQLTDANSWVGDITPDGRYLLFESVSAQLISGDTNGQNDIFRKDLSTGQIEIVSASAAGTPGNNKSQKRSISDDGRWVAFDSLSSNLTSDPHPGSGEAYYVYLKDMQTGEIKRISNSTVAGAFVGNSQRPEISGDGRFIVFESDGELVPADTNQKIDIYLYDRITENLVLVSRGDNGELSGDASNNAVISADGSTIAFTTASTNILGPKSVGGIVTVNLQRLLAEHRVELTPGAQSAGIDFGQVAVTSSLAGTLWQDDNGDGAIDAGEPRLPGRTVYIDTDNNRVFDTGEPTQVTLGDDPATPTINEAGTYQFASLSAGDYVVRQILPDGWTQTAPIDASGLRLLADSGYVHGINTATHPIYDSAASDDGRFVAFSTDKSMLPIDTNSGSDIYVINRDTGEVELISKSTSGVLANGVSRNVSISGDGRYVAYRSVAGNLSAIDNNNNWDIYVHDRALDRTTLISSKPPSETSGEVVGNSFSYNPKISRDGTVITFWSNSSNLIDGDTNGQFDVFLKDLQSGSIERVNVDSDENQATGGQSHESLPNLNGDLVGFWSNATNLVAGDNNGTNDVFIRDRQSGLTERVSVSATGQEGNGASDHFSMSDDGRYFAFMSNATNLTNDVGLTGSKQIFLKDRQSGSVTLVSKGDSGLPDGGSLYPAISADGRWVTYQSAATNIVPGDTNGVIDVFLYDTVNGTTTMLSQNVSGGASNGASDWPRMSRDGSTVMFNSAATDLVDQPPTTGGLYLYRTPTDDPYVARVTLGLEQPLQGVHFGSQVMVDRGDAPESYGPASHLLDPNVRLGNTVSFELSPGQDDPDDDGVVVNGRLSVGFDAHFDVTSSTAGTLAAWIDFDADGEFDLDERSEWMIGLPDASTTQTVVISIPSHAVIAATQARFRFGTDAVSLQLPTGPSSDGEVEDYAITLQSPVAASGITLSHSSINENLDTTAADLLFATLTAIDEDPGDSHSFDLVSGSGDTDNARFVITGDNLKLRQGESIDYENQSSYALRVRATDSTGLAIEQQIAIGVNNLIELAKSDVTVNGGSDQRSRVESVTIEFDTDVFLEEGAITIHKSGVGGGPIDALLSPVPGTAGRVFTLSSFSGDFTEYGSLHDGNYELRVDATKVISTEGFGLDANQDGITGDDFIFGDRASDKFFRFFGDTDGDRDVDGQDYGRFGLSFLSSSVDANFNASLDYDGDGDVDGSDHGRFSQSFLRRF